jgi:hypothetical protein
MIKEDVKHIRIDENFAIVVFWDPSGTKVLKSSLVGLETESDDARLS